MKSKYDCVCKPLTYSKHSKNSRSPLSRVGTMSVLLVIVSLSQREFTNEVTALGKTATRKGEEGNVLT